jgi:hypothetical protein
MPIDVIPRTSDRTTTPGVIGEGAPALISGTVVLGAGGSQVIVGPLPFSVAVLEAACFSLVLVSVSVSDLSLLESLSFFPVAVAVAVAVASSVASAVLDPSAVVSEGLSSVALAFSAAVVDSSSFAAMTPVRSIARGRTCFEKRMMSANGQESLKMDETDEASEEIGDVAKTTNDCREEIEVEKVPTVEEDKRETVDEVGKVDKTKNESGRY